MYTLLWEEIWGIILEFPVLLHLWFSPSLFFYSTILVCKRRIVDLFPKLERAVDNIKIAEAALMQMQMKRQKEFWYLLKIACVSI